jgi:hypothetical protein
MAISLPMKVDGLALMVERHVRVVPQVLGFGAVDRN